MSYLNLDAETFYFARELEQIIPKTFDEIKGPLDAFKLIPIDKTVDPGANIYTYKSYKTKGMARATADGGDDIPLVDVSGIEIPHNIKTFALGAEFTFQELRASNFAKKSLMEKKMTQVMRGHYEAWNYVAFHGDDAIGLTGWLSNPSVESKPVQNGDNDADRAWKGKNPDLIIDDVMEAINSVTIRSKSHFRPNTMAIDLTSYAYISSRPRSANSDTTILEFIERNIPNNFKIIPTAEFTKGFNKGKNSGFVIYNNDKETFWQEVPLDPFLHEPQKQNMKIKYFVESRYGGVCIAYPDSQAFRYGI